MQTNKFLIVNVISQKRFLFTTGLKNRRLCPTLDAALKIKGPRCLKPHRVMWKFLEKTQNNGIFSRPPVGAPSISLETAVTSIACRSIPVTKRSSILNKMFMRNITEILATSDIGLLLTEYNIQICKVRVNCDYSTLNVYWISQGTDDDEKIQYLLNKVANPLRQELITLRVMGLVPKIQFVKDKHYALLAEVDRRLKIADFGEDHVPALSNSDHIREDLQLITKLPEQLKEKISELEAQEPFNDSEEQQLPMMGMNVFGLNYNEILRSIKNGMVRSRRPKENVEDILNDSKAVFEVPSNAILDKKSWDKTSVKQFIKQRNRKLRKAQSKRAQEYEAIHTPYLELYEEADPTVELYNEFVENSFEDYFDDRIEQEM